MSSKELSQYVHTRKYLRSRVTRYYNNVESSLDSYSRVEKQRLVSKLKSLQKDLKDADAEIQKLIWDESKEDNEVEYEQELEICEEYEDKLFETLSRLEESYSHYEGQASNFNFSKLKPPTAPLPKYSGTQDESLIKFFNDFEAVIDKYNYSSYEKFILLKGQLSGRADILISSLESSKQSYQEAKNLLTSALASPLNQKFEAIHKLVKLKLPYSKDPYVFVSEMRVIDETFRNLKIEIDTVLQYFFWQAMNETLQNQFIQITNKTRPSLQEINENIFRAIERYLMVQKRFEEKPKRQPIRSELNQSKSPKNTSYSYATNVQYKNFRPCILCSKDNVSADHPIYKCIVFGTPKDKIDKLKKLNGCTKCGYINHLTKDCKFNFKSNCKYCGSLHFNFLCLHQASNFEINNSNEKAASSETTKEKAKEEAPKPKKGKVEVNNGVVWAESAQKSTSKGNCILPTFTCSVGGKFARVLKDSGCQLNFISDSLAKSCNSRTLDNEVSITVNGFNTAREYITKIVEVKLALGKNIHKVSAICIPSISMNLNLPNLGKIISCFKKSGYVLADKNLKENSQFISNIDFVLGTDSDYCLPTNSILFGNPVPSVYLDTPIGIVLTGNIERILSNINHLPNLTKENKVLGMQESESGSQPRFIQNSFTVETNETGSLRSNSDAHFAVLTEEGSVNEKELIRATEDILEGRCSKILSYDHEVINEEEVELNDRLVKFVLNNTVREDDGRLRMPIMWNGKVSHLLGKNFNLANQILKSNRKGFPKNKDKLLMTDEVFRDQEAQGIIEKIDLEQFRKQVPQHSFLAHMSIIKSERETSKCRVVYLSNLCEKNPSTPLTICHNQAIYPGPNLNSKLSTSLILLRFDKYLICFDLVKAFLQISLSPVDQNRLLFLWFKNVKKGDFSVMAYRMKRLPFGISCSPSLLMLALYKILIEDSTEDSSELKEIKKLIYHLSYMDNCAYSCNDESILRESFCKLKDIFAPYHFKLQQFVTNSLNLQNIINEDTNQKSEEMVKIFGLQWNRINDTLATKPLYLNPEADTKRLVLQSIAKNFDIFNFSGPLLNRARMFMHNLQKENSLGWDAKITCDQRRDWRNIAKQVNSSPTLQLKRFIGHRSGEFRLICFVDASKDIYGTVIYIQDLSTLDVSFLMARNRIVNRQLEGKGIPSLEFQAIVLGTECLIDIFKDISGPTAVIPIKIVDLQLYTDSMVSLNWINAHVNKLDKTQQKRTVFITNRLNHLSKICEECPVKFNFVSGYENPADHITRSVSYKRLKNSNYISGPTFISDPQALIMNQDILSVKIPNPNLTLPSEETSHYTISVGCDAKETAEHLIDLNRFSSFRSIVSIHKCIFKFIHKLKLKVKEKNLNNFLDLKRENFFQKAYNYVIQKDQHIYFKDCFNYFNSKTYHVMPNLIRQLNLFPDKENILRVRSKCSRGKDKRQNYSPILLSKDSPLTKLIIEAAHRKFSHAGCYTLLSELRKQYWVPKFYSQVKKVKKECVICKRMNEKTVSLNQSPYRDFRINPPSIPFRYLFLDYLGPYYVRYNGKKRKIWILCFTCLWSRAINLKICLDLTVKSFLRALQMHILEFGLPEFVGSDLGSQIVSAANIVEDFLKDVETQDYLQEHNIKGPKFEQYYKGNSSLGSLVESCVKLTKRIIFGSIGNNILDFLDFEFTVAQAINLVNRRPVAFKESLRDGSFDAPDIITPEKLLKGYELPSINIIPELQDDDPDWNVSPTTKVKENFDKLKKVRNKMIKIYNEEFVSNLIHQATNTKERYKPTTHKNLKSGDVVLLKEKYLKSSHYPMGIVKDVIVNINNETTGATILKGKTGEMVKRHVSSIIPLISQEESSRSESQTSLESSNTPTIQKRPRQAAIIGAEKTKRMLSV